MVEASDTKKKAKGASELEIGIVAIVFAVPKKYEDGLQVSEQEQQLREGFAELMATNLVLLTNTDAADFVPISPWHLTQTIPCSFWQRGHTRTVILSDGR